MFSYKDDVLSLRNCVHRIYPLSWKTKDVTDAAMSVSFLHLNLAIDSQGRSRTKLYDISILAWWTYHFMCSNIPVTPAYEVYISQLIRYSRACSIMISLLIRRVWWYQRGNQSPYIEEEKTTQWPKEKVQKDKQRSTKHTEDIELKVLSGKVEIITSKVIRSPQWPSMKSSCHSWPGMCSVFCCNYNPAVSLFMTYLIAFRFSLTYFHYQVCNKSNTKDARNWIPFWSTWVHARF